VWNEYGAKKVINALSKRAAPKAPTTGTGRLWLLIRPGWCRATCSS
jgi:hypothetical protein